MRIRKSALARIIREAVEHPDFNIQAAVSDAKDRGCSDAEIQSVLDSSARDEEIIMMLQKLGEDEFPVATEEE
jgi:hypothetical protein